MGRKYNYDYLIIGSGPAGLNLALTLGKAKKHVALVEGDELGGSYLNSRGIPYRVGLDFSHRYRQLLDSPAIHGQSPHFNFPTLAAEQQHIAATLRATYQQSLESLGVNFISGAAHFLDDHTISIKNAQYTAETFIIATGSTPKTTEISGLDHVDYLTPDTALAIRRAPEFVCIAGGGPTGIEIASYYAELGIKVLILERATRLLPHEDKEVSDFITTHLETDLGVTIITGAKLVAVDEDHTSKIAIFATAGQEKMVRTDCLVLATGLSPALDLGLENAHIKYKRTGILVDKLHQTSTKHIYAIGDVTSPAHFSAEHAETAALSLAAYLLHKTKPSPRYDSSTRLIHTSPEIAIVGLNEKDLLARDLKAKRSIIYLDTLPAGCLETTSHGFIKLLVDNTNHLLGASIVADHAAALSHTLSLAISAHLGLADLITTPAATTSPAYAIKLAARKLLKK